MSITATSSTPSWLLLAVCLFLVANTLFGACQATAALKLGGPTADNDGLVVLFHEDARSDLLEICRPGAQVTSTLQPSMTNLTCQLPSGICRHVYTGIMTGAAGAFGQDHLELMHICMEGGIQSWHPDAKIRAPELHVGQTQWRMQGRGLLRAQSAAAPSQILEASAGAQQQDPYLSEPSLPARVDDQRQLGMGAQLDWSSGVQLVPSNNLLWGLDRIDQQALPLNQKYQWGLSSTNMGQGVSIYVLDTGIRTSHQEFTQSGSNHMSRARQGAQFGALGGGSGAGSDCNGHGTMVASVAGGWATGVAKLASMVSVQVLNCNSTGPLSDSLAGLDWISHHAAPPAVVILSLGLADSKLAAPLDQAVLSLVEDFNLTVVAAAGNQQMDACQISPANLDAVITVGASEVDNKFNLGQQQHDILYTYSNSGSCVDLFAPGVDIYGACGGPDRCPGLNDSAYTYDTGTSFAAPFVAGAAAIYLSDHPLARPAEVQAALVSAAAQGQMNLSTALPGTPKALLSSLLLSPPVEAAAGPIQNTTRQSMPVG